MRKIILFLFLFVLPAFYSQGLASAAAGNVVISEIQVAGGTANDEFVELYNPTGADIDLSGWSIQYRGGASASYSKKNFSAGHIISAYGFFLIAHADYSGAVAADMAHSTFALSGTGGTVFLVNNQTLLTADTDSGETVADKAAYGSGTNLRPESSPAAAPEAGKSIARKIANNLMQDTDDNSVDFEIKNSPDPQNTAAAKLEPGEGGQSGEGDGGGSEEQTAPQTSPGGGRGDTGIYNLGDVVINEFVSDPSDGEEEWIELYNASGKEINLSGWTITEGSGSETDLEGSLAASGDGRFKTIEKPKGNLNNGGDIIVLRDAGGNLIDQVAYGNWDDGDTANNAPVANDPGAVARKFDGYNTYNNAGDFSATDMPTKDAGNIIGSEEVAEADGYDYSPDIVINEIFPNPAGDDTENEFIELYNKGTRDVDLSGWRLGDDSNKKYEIADEGNIIKAGGYLVIYRKESKIALNNTSDSVKLYQPLKDEPLQTVKYEKAVENWSYAGSDNNKWVWTEIVTPGKENVIKTTNHAPAVDFNFPEKIYVGVPAIFDSSDTTDEDGDKLTYKWDFGDGVENNLANPEHTFLKEGAYSVKLTVSDGENEVKKEKIVKVNSGLIVSVYDSAAESGGAIIINEVLPSPEGDDAEGEWLELYNAGAEEVNLLNWKVDDGEGGSRPYEFLENLLISPGNFYVLERLESGLALNNDSDSVRLFNNLGELAEEIKYGSAAEGESYARGVGGEWYWTTVLTPGEGNEIKAAVAKSSAKKKKVLGARAANVPLGKIKDFDPGDFITTKGVVAVVPGVLGTQFFYIVSPVGEENPGGIQVYNYKKDFPELAVGDYIEVSGELSSVNGELRIKTDAKDDMKIIERREAPEAVELSCDKINEDYTGRLVKIAGEITERKSSTVYLDDGADEAVVYIKKATGINPASIKEGETAAIIGIAGRTKSGVRIMPRSLEDIIMTGASAAGLPGEASLSDEWEIAARNKKTELLKYLLVIAAGVIITLAVLLTKIIRRSKQ